MPSTSRRALLGTVAGGVGALAGCAAGQGQGCNGDAASFADDRLEPLFRNVDRRGDEFRMDVRVNSEYEAIYHGARLNVFDPTGELATSVEFGTVDSRGSPWKRIATTSFPMVVATEAASAEHESECNHSELGSVARGYAGYWPDGAPNWYDGERSGHIWLLAGKIPLTKQLPERGRPFARVRCRHRAIVANGNRDHLWLLTGTDASVPSPFPGAVTTMRYRFLAPRPDPGNGRVEPDGWKSVPARRVPAPVEELTESAGRELTVDAKTFVEYLDALEGPEVDAAAGLPSCSEVHVSCRDTRRPGCRYGGRFTGTEGRYFAYDILSERVYAAHERVWEPPSDIDGRQRRSTGGGP